MSDTSNSRRAVAEIRPGDNRPAWATIGSRSIHQFWHLLSPHFREVLLPPQRRPDSGGVSWAWREAGGSSPLTAAELAEVRRRLDRAAQSMAGPGVQSSRAEAAGDADPVPDPGAQLQAGVRALVAQLTASPDPVLAGFVCRTGSGPMVHSWGAATPARPYFPDTLECEIGGVVIMGAESAAGLAIVIENRQGAILARTQADAAGAFRFQKIGPGNYRIRVIDRGDFPASGFAVTVERESIAGLELRRGAAVATFASPAAPGSPQPVIAPADPEPASIVPAAPAGGRRQRFGSRRIAAGIAAVLLLSAAGGWVLATRSATAGAHPGGAPRSWWQSVRGQLVAYFQRSTPGHAGPVGEERVSSGPATPSPASNGSNGSGRSEAARPASIVPPTGSAAVLAPSAVSRSPDLGVASSLSKSESGEERIPPAAAKSVHRTPAAGRGGSREEAGNTSPLAEDPRGAGTNVAGETREAGAAPDDGAESVADGSGQAPRTARPPTRNAAATRRSASSGPVRSATASTEAEGASSGAAAAGQGGGSRSRRAALRPASASPTSPSSADARVDAAGDGELSPNPAATAASPGNDRAAENAPPAAPSPTSVAERPADGVAGSATTPSPDGRGGSRSETDAPGRRRRVVVSAWAPRLIHDAILPTRPMPVGADDAVETTREKLLQEHQDRMPAAFRHPVTAGGFVLEFLAPKAVPGQAPQWRDAAGGVPAGTSVRGHRAEVSWPGANPPRDLDLSLRRPDGVEMARVSVDADGAPCVSAIEEIRSWFWIGVEGGATETGLVSPLEPSGRFAWRLASGGLVPDSWRRDDGWRGGRGYRIELPMGEGTPGPAVDALALVDDLTGWALVGEISRPWGED
jgi:hypothetical protein